MSEDWMTIFSIYVAIAIVVGPLATWRLRWIFRYGSYRCSRAVAFSLIVGALWWLIGPLVLFGLGKGKYEL